MYRESFFEHLIKLGIDSEIDYQIYSGKTPMDSSGRNDGQNLSTIWTEVPSCEFNLWGRSIIVHKLKADWRSADLIIAEHAIRNLVLYKWVLWQRLNRLALWGHGKTYTKANSKFEEWLKMKLVNRVDWFFGYTQKGVESVIDNGFDPRRTTVVRNSTDTNHLKNLINLVRSDSISDFKTINSLGDGPVGVFIGALDASKRLDFLISSSIEIHKQLTGFQLLIFGNGPELEKVRAATEKFPFIKYCGRADLETQALISKIAKIILMPGRVGLIAVDSFALGLPIVTTKWLWHAPEFEYLSNGRNSLISNNTLEDYSLGVVNLIRDESKLNELRNNCLEDSKIYTIETMAFNFHEGVMKVLSEVNPRGH